MTLSSAPITTVFQYLLAKPYGYITVSITVIGTPRNIFSLDVDLYTKKVPERKAAFAAACVIWIEADQQLLCV